MAHPLDDRAFVTRLDPSGMLRLTEDFPQQCRRALDLARQAELAPLDFEPSLVLLTGLGGSAAGGDFVQALFELQGRSPFLVNRDYGLPRFAGEKTLVFAVSYSGNTEETLAAYEDAKAKGCRVVAVTSGGKLAERAAADGFSTILVPGGQPPRTALGYLFVPVAAACERLGLLPGQPWDAAFAALDESSRVWGMGKDLDENPAKQLAEKLHGKLPILYGLGSWQGAVAKRWKAQVNENAKNHCFWHQFPELNHNEILGWVECQSQGVSRWAVVLLSGGEEGPKLRARAKVSFELIGDRAEFFEASALGTSPLEKMLSLVYCGDFVSIYLAALNGVDPENIDWLNYLKAQLAKVP